MIQCACSGICDFNPLHREGGDVWRTSTILIFSGFQSTPPRGWRRDLRLILIGISCHFNPLHREGGDDYEVSDLKGSGIFQSTPPRGWRPTGIYISLESDSISIHSTARVETLYLNPFGISLIISIHSTARVETLSRSRSG